MKRGTLLLAVSLIHICALPVAAKLVACVGDSITYGAGITDPANNGYPAQLERILQEYDPAWQVENFGVSGTTLLRQGDLPYFRQGAYANAQLCNPDVVIIKLGTNDSKPQNWQYRASFIADYAQLIDVFRALPSKPQIWICKPVPAFGEVWGIRPNVIREEILPMIDEIARQKDVPVIDLYTALLDFGNLFPDKIHPNAAGAGVMAQTIAPYLLGVRFMPDFNDDGIVNLVDFARLAGRWLEQEDSLDIAPAESDGAVSYADLAGLGRYWMTYPGLLAHWLLDESEGELAADRLWRFIGTLHGSPVWRPQQGRIGGALELDGIDDYVSVGSPFSRVLGQFTVFMWVKGGQPGQVVLSESRVGGQIWLGTQAPTGAIMTAVTDNGRLTHPLVAEASITDGLWHHIRLVWDGSYRTLYVDGREVAVDTRKLGNLRSSNTGFYFGAAGDLGSGSFWSGLIDDVRFYNRALKP